MGRRTASWQNQVDLFARQYCTSTQLLGNKLHTWHGTTKFEKHFQVINSGDTTDEDLSVRCDVFCHYDNGDLKSKAIISVNTIFSRCSTFYVHDMMVWDMEMNLFAHMKVTDLTDLLTTLQCSYFSCVQ